MDPTAAMPVRYVSPTGTLAGGTGDSTLEDLPAEVRGGWNWGGCTLGCLWAFAMNLPFWGILALLSSLCGPLALAVSVVLGLKGNEWAWKNRRWQSVEHFRKVQRIWATVGISLTIVALGLYAVYAYVVFAGLAP